MSGWRTSQQSAGDAPSADMARKPRRRRSERRGENECLRRLPDDVSSPRLAESVPPGGSTGQRTGGGTIILLRPLGLEAFNGTR